MTQYIDKSALVAEIERRIKFNEKLNAHSRLDECYAILSFLNTLEAKEEILDKEGKTKLMRKCVHKAYKRGYDMGVLQTTNKINHNMKEVDLDYIKKELDELIRVNKPNGDFGWGTLYNVATHFFELGLKVQKEE